MLVPASAVVVAFAIVAATPAPALAQANARWLSGDLSTHTYLTDGRSTQSEIIARAMSPAPHGYGLGYLADSEPGGQSSTNSGGLAFELPVWRWLTLALYSFPLIAKARTDFPGRLVIQGLQWDTPTRGQVSVGVVGAANEPQGISDFEYLFDRLDTDTSRAGESVPAVLDTTKPSPYPTLVPAQSMAKQNTTAQDTLDGAAFLEHRYPRESYAIVDHPSRDLDWTVGDLRALQDAAPDVVCGFEGFPGDQAAAARGGYGNDFDAGGNVVSGPGDPGYSPSETDRARTYGGADAMVAKIGGVWDALLAEGRPWYVYGDSEFKWRKTVYGSGAASSASFNDFWPGEYDKTWTYARAGGYEGLVAAIKSGDSFVVNGDLVKALDFHATAGKVARTMGQTLTVKKGQRVVVTIRFKSPSTNNNGSRVRVDHIDLIEGNVTRRVAPSSPGYDTTATNPTAHVVETFGRTQMRAIDGWEVMTVAFAPKASMYFRLRGTNLRVDKPNQTDSAGDPLVDRLTYRRLPNPDPSNAATVPTVTINTPDQAWSDLWLYSNPIFVHVR
jgi:hypothetical protein